MKIEKNTARIEDMTKTIKGETVLSGVSMELFGERFTASSEKTVRARLCSSGRSPD